MSAVCRSRALAAAAGLLAASAATAQIRIQRVLTADQGLVQTQVLTMAEDRDGSLWFGTNDGVSRFDGAAFTNFQSREGLPGGAVNDLHPTADGRLWAATDHGVFRAENGRFAPLPAATGLDRGSVRAVAEGPGGSLLFAHAAGVVTLGRDGAVRRLPAERLGGRPTALLPARDGILYAGTDHGLALVRGDDVRRAGPAEGVAPVLALHEGRGGAVVLGTRAGLAVWRGGGASPVPGLADEVRAIAEGADGTLYLATPASGVRLARWDSAGALRLVDSLTTANGLPTDLIFSLHETRDGAVYFGTDRGVAVYRHDIFQSWTKGTGLPDDDVWSIAEDGRGGTWLGTGKGLAHRRDGRWMALGRRDGLPDDTVRSVLIDAAGRLWAGTQRGGLAVFAPDGRLLRVLGPRDGLPHEFVRALWEAPGGTVWAGTQNGLAWIRMDGRTAVRALGSADGMPDGAVNSITAAPDGAVWLGTANGLVRWAGGAFRTWLPRDGLADPTVWSVTVGKDGTVYAGTARGLSILRSDRNGSRFETIDARRGLTNETIYCTVDDGAGHLYASTNRGVNVLDLAAGKGGPALRTLQRADGLADNEGNLGACHADPQGRIWFGGVAGVSVYDPSRDRPAPVPPRVRIAGLRLFDRELPLPAAGPPTFRSNENYFQFSYVGIDLAVPQKVRYRYRLAGLDRGWIETDRRSVQYTNLDPGDYRFEVQAADSWGRWSPPAGLPFTILTPVWRRWWFLLLAVLTAGSAAAFVLTARVRQLLAIERLRTALAADLHDHIGAGLTEISILAEIAAQRLPGQAAPELATMADTARRLVDRMDDIVWLVNPLRDSLHELFLRLKDSYSELFSHAGVLFHTSNLRLFEDVRLPMAYRENLYLIFKEALSNSLRHSGCREIGLTVEIRGRRLEVELRDDGRGFDPAGPAGGNGLENMKARAARIGGRLSIDAAPGGGTAVRFAGPLG
jgi:ligand-binding sensor domain-containing protein/signal transduction histidine kinase